MTSREYVKAAIEAPPQDIQKDVPVENIMALLEVAREKVG